MTKVSTARPWVLVLEFGGGGPATDRVFAAGGVPVTVSPRDLVGVEEAFDEGAVDALTLTGGGDVDPRRYGRRPHKRTYGVSEARDRVEFRAVELANASGVPVLGICRGAQVLNVSHGGTLRQHLPDQLGTDRRHHSDQPVHALRGSLVERALGRRTATVVHLHHQAVERVAPGWRVTAWHADGTAEAVEREDGPWAVGAQFHPEMALEGAPEHGLFRQLVLAAAEAANLPVPRPRRLLAPPPVRVQAATPPVPAPTWTPAPTSAPTLLTSWPERPTRVSHHRPAGTPWHPVDVRWRCFRCVVDFDERVDFVDHMAVLHHVTVGDGTKLPARG